MKRALCPWSGTLLPSQVSSLRFAARRAYFTQPLERIVESGAVGVTGKAPLPMLKNTPHSFGILSTQRIVSGKDIFEASELPTYEVVSINGTTTTKSMELWFETGQKETDNLINTPRIEPTVSEISGGTEEEEKTNITYRMDSTKRKRKRKMRKHKFKKRMKETLFERKKLGKL